MNKHIKITLQALNKNIQVNKGTPLIDILHEFGVEFPCGGKGSCGACKVKLLDGELNKSKAEQEKLKQLNVKEGWRLACYCAAESDITLEVAQFEHMILADESIFEFHAKQGAGIAVDLGTTTIVAQLLDLQSGAVLDSVSELNSQVKYGADLISRIQNCMDGHQTHMQQLIRDKIGKLIRIMLDKHTVDLVKIELVGNTVMQHIFCGSSIQPLAMYPFHSPDLQAKTFSTAELGWKLPGQVEVKFHASIGSFVGSDILAGIAATKMTEKETFSVLIDLGTNGEIAVGNRHKILCASTAAGPAFEGAKISQGMRASTGAISSAEKKDGTFKIHVIGNTEAKGICGSGLIDVIACLLHEAKIGMFGEINSGAEFVQISKNVKLTQQDIREFQLAKAALATGIQLLLKHLKINMNNVENIYISGGFGNFLNIQNVIRTGLIEAGDEKIHKLGNTALIGAKMFLFKDETEIQKILDITSHVNLEGDPAFQDIYIEKMMLE